MDYIIIHHNYLNNVSYSSYSNFQCLSKLKPNYLPDIEVNLPHNCKMPSKNVQISQLNSAESTKVGQSCDQFKHIKSKTLLLSLVKTSTAS